MNKYPAIYKIILFFGVVSIGIIGSCSMSNKFVIQSPNALLKVMVKVNKQNKLVYTVVYNSQTVIEQSGLGILRADADFASNLKIVEVSVNKPITDNYTLVVHKKSNYNYLANQKTITVQNAGGQKMQVIFQVSDNGVAFRYYFADTITNVKQITAETTQFAFNSNAKAWLQPCAHAKAGWGNTNPSYEEHYMQNIPVGTTSPMAGWVFPALFKTGDNWVLISETAVDRNYCASRLAVKSDNGVYSIAFPDAREVVFDGRLNPQSTLPWYTPWRIIAVGSLANIVESTLATDLANKPVAGNFSWVKPGRASWSWVLLKDEKTIYPVQKQFIDYAAQMGWEYCLIDSGWDTQIGYDKIEELANYATSKNVKILLWYNSAGNWNTAPLTPKHALLTSEQRTAEFNRIKKMGVAGIKIDFFGGDGLSVINHYIDIFTDAAKAGLVVNCHGSTLPRGWHRTYPNLLSMEAVKGLEFATFAQSDANLVPNHCAMLPFTRNVFSPMDFTPVCFGEINNIERVTTNAFELALAVIFQSGVQHFAEIPEVMQKQPDFVVNILKQIPVVWDQTRFVGGFPGNYVVLARRAGNTWYVAGINGSETQKNITIDLSFTNKTNGVLITDGNTNRSFVQNNISFDNKQPINLMLKPNGGFVLKLQ